MGLMSEAKKVKEGKTAISLGSGKLIVGGESFLDQLKKIKLGEREGAAKEVVKETKEPEAKGGAKRDLSDIRDAIRLKLKDVDLKSELRHKAENRISTGIPGLDEVMEGGFRKGSVNMVGGGAGSGKTIFTMQFLVKGIEQCNENALFISFEQGEEKIIDDFRRFDWDLKGKINAKKLAILYYTPEQVEKVLESGGGTVRDVIESMKIKRIAIDSLTAFTLLHESELAKRKAVLQLFEAVRSWGCTALMVSEQEPDPDKHKSTVMEFEVDGVILLYNLRKGDIRERSLEIFKMRGTSHAQKIFPMKIDDSGIVIFPDETVF